MMTSSNPSSRPSRSHPPLNNGNSNTSGSSNDSPHPHTHYPPAPAIAAPFLTKPPSEHPDGPVNNKDTNTDIVSGHPNGTAAADTDANSNGSTAKIFRPVVFQCKQCRTIVADSSDLCATDPVQRLISIRSVGTLTAAAAAGSSTHHHPNIVVRPEWHLQPDGPSFGSVFQTLQCRKCAAELGVRYHTTNAANDHLRGMLSLRTETLLMYELQFDEDRVRKDIEEAMAGHMGVAASFGSDCAASSDYRAGAADVEVVKLQKFCLVLYDRVVRLEEQVIALSAVKGGADQ